MATIQIEIDDEAFRPLIQQIVKAALEGLDLQSIARAAALEAAKRSRAFVKVMYSSGEVAKLLGITVVALQARRLNGRIRGVREVGGRSYLYSREEVERVLGRSLSDS